MVGRLADWDGDARHYARFVVRAVMTQWLAGGRGEGESVGGEEEEEQEGGINEEA